MALTGRGHETAKLASRLQLKADALRFNMSTLELPVQYVATPQSQLREVRVAALLAWQVPSESQGIVSSVTNSKLPIGSGCA